MVEAAMGRSGARVGGGVGRRRLEPAARGHGEVAGSARRKTRARGAVDTRTGGGCVSGEGSAALVYNSGRAKTSGSGGNMVFLPFI